MNDRYFPTFNPGDKVRAIDAKNTCSLHESGIYTIIRCREALGCIFASVSEADNGSNGYYTWRFELISSDDVL